MKINPGLLLGLTDVLISPCSWDGIFTVLSDELHRLLSLHYDFFREDHTANGQGHVRILKYFLSEKMPCDSLSALGHTDDNLAVLPFSLSIRAQALWLSSVSPDF